LTHPLDTISTGTRTVWKQLKWQFDSSTVALSTITDANLEEEKQMTREKNVHSAHVRRAASSLEIWK
jgi:hypothetical protein